MNVTVQYFAQLGIAAGTRREQVQLDAPCSARELVRRLAAEHGNEFASAVLDGDGDLRRTVLLFVDDTQIDWHDAAPLRDGQTLVLATPIAGG